MKTVIFTENAPKAIGPYSQSIEINDILFSSGQIAINPKTANIEVQTIEEQTHQVCQNLKAVLESRNLTFDNVVKTTCFLADMNDFAKFNSVYAEYFTSCPARSCVAAKALPKNALVEIEVIAVR